jgi:hypothetical protein
MSFLADNFPENGVKNDRMQPQQDFATILVWKSFSGNSPDFFAMEWSESQIFR